MCALEKGVQPNVKLLTMTRDDASVWKRMKAADGLYLLLVIV